MNRNMPIDDSMSRMYPNVMPQIVKIQTTEHLIYMWRLQIAEFYRLLEFNKIMCEHPNRIDLERVKQEFDALLDYAIYSINMHDSEFKVYSEDNLSKWKELNDHFNILFNHLTSDIVATFNRVHNTVAFRISSFELQASPWYTKAEREGHVINPNPPSMVMVF